MYGLSDKDLEQAKYKIKANKAFMSSHGIVIDDKIVPFKDFVSNSYINSDRYIAELQHRAWSVYDYAKSRNLSNIFLTLTLPSKWHNQKTHKGRLVPNPKFGGRYFISHKKIIHPTTGEFLKLINSKENIEKYKPRNASKELSSLLKKMYDDISYKSIDKEDRIFFRVIEPHKSGTPHVHMSLFVPEDKKDKLVKAINRLFPAPQSKLELNVNSPVSYLMKYVLKTLDDLREDVNNLTSLSLWYVYHGISRFYTSRTFVALDIYRKLQGMYSLNDLTKSYHNEDLQVHYNTQTGDIAKIENEFGTLYTPKPIVSRFNNPQWREDMHNEDNTYYNYEFEPIKFVHKKPVMVYLEQGDKKYIVNNGLLTEIKTKPYQMSDMDLNVHFNNLDLTIVNPQYYANTHNIMLERGLMMGERLSLDEFQEASEVF